MVKELGAGEDAEAGAMRMNRGAGRHMESKLPQVPQRWPQRLLRSLAAALLLAFLGVAAWPISPWRSGEKYVVAITALGEKSPDAASSEVWIAGAPDGVDLGALAASSTTPLGWEQRGQTLVSYRDQPATISFHGVLKPEDQFLFGRHHWSGRVRVEINGQARDYDLHSPEPTTPLAVALSDFPAGKAARTGPNPAFLLWLAVWTVALAALLLAGPGLLRRLPPGPSEAPGLDGIRFALPSLIVFGFVLAGTWPAQMSPDSVFQWDQLHTGNLNNWAPVIHTVLVGGLGALLGSIGWSMILQIVALAAAIGFLCRELSRWSINRIGLDGCGRHPAVARRRAAVDRLLEGHPLFDRALRVDCAGPGAGPHRRRCRRTSILYGRPRRDALPRRRLPPQRRHRHVGRRTIGGDRLPPRVTEPRDTLAIVGWRRPPLRLVDRAPAGRGDSRGSPACCYDSYAYSSRDGG